MLQISDSQTVAYVSINYVGYFFLKIRGIKSKEFFIPETPQNMHSYKEFHVILMQTENQLNRETHLNK